MLKGIHCFSTAPFRGGRSISGDKRISHEDKFTYPDYALVTLVASALEWKAKNGPIVLHTDHIFYKYLEERKLLSCWNQVLCTLDSFEEENRGLDHGVFWAACKFYCYSLEKAPFACIDTDAVVLEKLKPNPWTDLMVAHFESIEPGDSNYIEQSGLCVNEGYDFFEDKWRPNLGLNMSVCCFMNEDFKKIFIEEAQRFMKNANASYDGRYAMPELLYMEQVLPVQIAHIHHYCIEPVINCIWSPGKFRFIKDDSRLGSWQFNKIDKSKPLMHLWFHKNYIDKNAAAHKEYMDQLWEFLQAGHPEKYDSIKEAVSCPRGYTFSGIP